MADECDKAASWQAQHNAASLQQARRAYREAVLEIDGERVCRDCYDTIPPARLAASPDAVRCLDCQEKKEQRDGLRAG